jgi:hypothetical protein
MMCGIMSIQADPTPGGEIKMSGSDLAIAAACRAADVDYDEFTLTIAAGSYPCLPHAIGGTPRRFDETDLLTLCIYGRLKSFGFGALRAGEYACRIHRAIRANANARFVSLALTSDGGKRVVIDVAAPKSAFAGKLEFDIPAIREFLKARTGADSQRGLAE